MLGERMKIVISPPCGPKCGSRSLFSGLFRPDAPSGRIPGAPRPESHGTAPPGQVAHTHMVVGRIGEETKIIHSRHTTDLHLKRRTDHFAPAKGLLDPVAGALAGDVTRMPCGAPIDRRTAVRGVLGHVWRGIPAAQIVDEVGAVMAAIAADRHAVVPRKPRDHVHGRRALPGAAGGGQLVIHDQAVAVFHQDMALVDELRAPAPALAIQPRLGIRLGGMRVTAALLHPIDIAAAHLEQPFAIDRTKQLRQLIRSSCVASGVEPECDSPLRPQSPLL